MTKTNALYELPALEYDAKHLAPYISEEQLLLHHGKHHQAYVNGANQILVKLDKARNENVDLDMKSTLKELSFNIGGHLLHSLFWGNLAPEGKGGAKPEGKLAKALVTEFGSVDRFIREFTQAALSVEGSGWAALTYCMQAGRPIIMQIEKHNNNVYPMFTILMVADVFEHAYYVDYRNDRAKYVDALFHVMNWNAVEKRLEDLLGQQ
jgi:superoxide dismutase, Fe-Mn family